MFLEKRSLSEIITMYTLETSLKDIFVEGPTDSQIFENYLDSKQIEKTIYEINDIDLFETQEKYADLDLKSNKDKLIALSRELVSENIIAGVLCVVDRDFDGIIQPLESNKFIIYTDYSCIESYFLSEKFFKKFLSVSIPNFPFLPNQVIREVSTISSQFFKLRLISKKFNYAATIPKIENSITIDKLKGKCTLNFDRVLDTYINFNKLSKDKEQIHNFVSSQILPQDNRFIINGHDLIEILFHYIKKVKNTLTLRLDAFDRLFYATFQPNYFEHYSLFKTLEC